MKNLLFFAVIIGVCLLLTFFLPEWITNGLLLFLMLVVVVNEGWQIIEKREEPENHETEEGTDHA